jgi:hypothetical protein
MTFTRSIAVDAQTELSAYELRLLADASVELADQYERHAAFMEAEEQRQVAVALSEWRRTRARYFRELSAEAQRIEAPLLASAREYLCGRHESAHGVPGRD